jgi:hypothetical protein
MASKYIVLPWDKYKSLLRGHTAQLIPDPSKMKTDDVYNGQLVPDPSVRNAEKAHYDGQMIHDPSVRKTDDTSNIIPAVRKKSRGTGSHLVSRLPLPTLNIQGAKPWKKQRSPQRLNTTSKPRLGGRHPKLTTDVPPPPGRKRIRTEWINY